MGALVVEPVDPVQGLDLDVLHVAPGTQGSDELGCVGADVGLASALSYASPTEPTEASTPAVMSGWAHRGGDQSLIRYHRHISITTPSLDGPGLRRGAALFHGLADRTRLAIVRQLAEGERRVVDLTPALGLAQGTVSGHLACLRDCGLIVGRPEGRQIFYSLAHPELFDVLGAAEQLLALTGDMVELCPNYGVTADTATSDTVSTTHEEHTR